MSIYLQEYIKYPVDYTLKIYRVHVACLMDKASATYPHRAKGRGLKFRPNNSYHHNLETSPPMGATKKHA